MDSAGLEQGFAGLDLFTEAWFPGLTVPIEERRASLVKPGSVKLVSHELAFPQKEIPLEQQKLGAVTGILRRNDGSVAINWFEKFAVTPKVVEFPLSDPHFDPIRHLSAVQDHITMNCYGETMTGIYALCSPFWWEDFLSHPNVQRLWNSDPLVKSPYEFFNFCGITFEMDEERRVADGVAHLFPLGTKSTFRIWRVPKQYQRPDRASAFAVCLRPELLVQGGMA
jgi:hypothetical protein